ncbi:MAG TPA: hypothetical protein VHP33_35930 [Polyangiaceae bacterium]|nr:hypothetical protein [Polyangiaceae bacterium]
MAKLVPATCPKCGANVKLDPDREFVTCQFCGASSFVQTQKRPVTQYVHQHHMPVIHVPHVQRGCVSAIAVVGALLGVGGAIAGGLVAYFSASTAADVSQLVTTPAPTATPGGAGVAAPDEPQGRLVEEDYFADATLAKARYEAKLGKPIMAKQLVLMQYYATLEAQDPKNREHVDSYKLWANKVERPQPVRLGSDKQQLQQLLFSLDSVDFKLVPTLIKKALAELKLEESKVSNVILERDGSSPQREPIWRVYVMGSRDNGFVEFSVTGEKRRSFP